VKGTAKGYFKLILAELKSIGYRVEARLLDAQWLGVPQSRVRLIFVGVREDLGKDPTWPKPLPYCYSVRDALDAAPRAHVPGPPNDGQSLVGFAIHEEWKKLRLGETSERLFSLTRPHPDRPCPTIVATGGHGGTASVTHPFEARKPTMAELRRLCGFPDDYVLTGSFLQQWKRLGNAVPPPMLAAVARGIAREVFGKEPPAL
jgi:DNA (cytosine-5)-methyltransferase 1